MKYKVRYVDDARQDIRDAKSWYRAQRPGLQKRFAADVKQAIESFRKNPEIHAIRYKNIRIAHPKEFPYGIHYFIDEAAKRIEIVAVIHQRRDTTEIGNRH